MDHIYTYAEWFELRFGRSAEGYGAEARDQHFCPQMQALPACTSVNILWETSGGWHIDTSVEYVGVPITYCPFCGVKLPDMSTAGGN